MPTDQYYKLTQRQFYNIVNGFRKKEDLLSRERWMIARKIMYSTMAPYLGKEVKETDIIAFPWEETLIQQMTEEEEILMLEQQKQSEAFFARWDARKNGIA